MRVLLTLALISLAGAAPAQTVFDALHGQYGSAADPETSCAANPHQLDFMATPPHALFIWANPRLGGQGQMSIEERYDLLGYDATTLTLRLEGDMRLTAVGHHPVWILRLTHDPQGYCWGRTDWPSLRCERQQLRCDSSTS